MTRVGWPKFATKKLMVIFWGNKIVKKYAILSKPICVHEEIFFPQHTHNLDMFNEKIYMTRVGWPKFATKKLMVIFWGNKIVKKYAILSKPICV